MHILKSNTKTNKLRRLILYSLLITKVYQSFVLVNNQFTCSSSFEAPAIIRTMILPKATVSSQPACSTDFMLVGAYRNKIYNSIVSNLVSKSSKGYLVLRICKVLQYQHGPEIFIVNKTQPS